MTADSRNEVVMAKARAGALVSVFAAATALSMPAAAADLWLVGAGGQADSGTNARALFDECNGPSAAGGAYCGGTYSPTKTTASGSVNADGPSPGSASASADLASGKLRASASVGGPVGRRGDLIGAFSSAYLKDTLHFDLGGAASPVPVVVKLRVDGSFLGQGFPWSSIVTFGLSDHYSGLSATVGYAGESPASGGTASSTSSPYTFYTFSKAGDWSTFGPEYFSGTFYLSPSHPDLYLNMSLDLAVSEGGGFSAFDHTTAITFDMPAGVTFTSGSNTFLTAAGASVPEPAAWTMMLLGFGGLGAVLRSRRKSVVAA